MTTYKTFLVTLPGNKRFWYRDESKCLAAYGILGFMCDVAVDGTIYATGTETAYGTIVEIDDRLAELESIDGYDMRLCDDTCDYTYAADIAGQRVTFDVRDFTTLDALLAHLQNAATVQNNGIVRTVANLLLDAFMNGAMSYHNFSAYGLTVSYRGSKDKTYFTLWYGSNETSAVLWDSDLENEGVLPDMFYDMVARAMLVNEPVHYMLPDHYQTALDMLQTAYHSGMAMCAPITVLGITLHVRKCLDFNEVTLFTTHKKLVENVPHNGYLTGTRWVADNTIETMLFNLVTVEG